LLVASPDAASSGTAAAPPAVAVIAAAAAAVAPAPASFGTNAWASEPASVAAWVSAACFAHSCALVSDAPHVLQ
jgi:hypothetical protein